MKEHEYDDLLNINTCGGQRNFNKSLHYHRYEPTPYDALDTLFAQYTLKSSDRVVDFGCGKGRLVFYINYVFNVTVIGVEMNDLLYKEAVLNYNQYIKKYKNRKAKIEMHYCFAEEYEIHQADNRFYFFNPFSIQIFRNIINNILDSVEKYERDIELLLYYVSDEYIYFLEKDTAFELKQEIILPGLYESNVHERFLIYRLNFSSR